MYIKRYSAWSIHENLFSVKECWKLHLIESLNMALIESSHDSNGGMQPSVGVSVHAELPRRYKTHHTHTDVRLYICWVLVSHFILAQHDGLSSHSVAKSRNRPDIQLSRFNPCWTPLPGWFSQRKSTRPSVRCSTTYTGWECRSGLISSWRC